MAHFVTDFCAIYLSNSSSIVEAPRVVPQRDQRAFQMFHLQGETAAVLISQAQAQAPCTSEHSMRSSASDLESGRN